MIVVCVFFFLELVSKPYISESAQFWIFMIIILKASFSDHFMQHNCLVKEICFYSDFILFACQHCFLNLISCMMMSLCFQYAAYTQCDCECVDLFWKFLNCTYTKLFSELVAVEEKQIWLFVKIVCLQKILNQLQNHIKQKILCFAEELVDDNDKIKNKNEILFLTSQLINSLLLFFWKFIFIFSQNIEVFLCSSWDFLWVFKYFLRHCILFTWWDNEISC